MMMETAYYSETCIISHWTLQCHISEDRNMNTSFLFTYTINIMKNSCLFQVSTDMFMQTQTTEGSVRCVSR
jgi:hypothetical protein